MKGISSWDDLRPYGIVPLTSESCPLSYRILCDVTERGKNIIEKCLGCEIKFSEKRDSGSDDEPHIGSIMLSNEFIIPLGIFALLESGCCEVWLVWNAVTGIESTDSTECINSMQQRYGKQLRRKFSYDAHDDGNRHQMSG